MTTTHPSHDLDRGATERATFLSGRDVVDRIRSLLSRLGDILAEASTRDAAPRARSVVEILERERARIAFETLADFDALASPATLARMVQYSTTIPSAMLQPPENPSPHALAAWMAATIDRFGMTFDELAPGCESERAEESFRSLATCMRAHARRIARISTEALLEGDAPRERNRRAATGEHGS